MKGLTPAERARIIVVVFSAVFWLVYGAYFTSQIMLSFAVIFWLLGSVSLYLGFGLERIEDKAPVVSQPQPPPGRKMSLKPPEAQLEQPEPRQPALQEEPSVVDLLEGTGDWVPIR